MTALTPQKQAEVNIARARWRADLLDYDADLLEGIGKRRDAASKRADANDRRAIADAEEAFEAVIAKYGGKSPEGYEAAERLRAVRSEHRTETVDVFASDGNEYDEPSVEDLGIKVRKADLT